jgi:CheY-like chemotaxis protein
MERRRQIKDDRNESRQVLVVDDDQDSADSLGRLMRLGGHQVQVAYSGEVAILLAQQLKPDVILLDLGLPRLDGYRVVEKLRQQPGTKTALIVAVTGYGQASDRQRCKEAGFDLHLLKPIRTEKLLQLLRGDLTLLIENRW